MGPNVYVFIALEFFALVALAVCLWATISRVAALERKVTALRIARVEDRLHKNPRSLHHLDGDPANNSLSNLALVDPADTPRVCKIERHDTGGFDHGEGTAETNPAYFPEGP